MEKMGAAPDSPLRGQMGSVLSERFGTHCVEKNEG